MARGRLAGRKNRRNLFGGLQDAQRGTHQPWRDEDNEEAATEAAYSVKAAKTIAPTSTANAKAIRATAMQTNAELACSFGKKHP
jgi:hypothetical protein